MPFTHRLLHTSPLQLRTLSPSLNDMRPIITAFHLAHAMGSSSSSHIPLYHILEAIFIRPLKEIANRLAYIWSRICLPNPLRLSLWDILPGRGRYRHYRSRTEEQRWWDESARTRAFFASSDARHRGKGKVSSPECLSPIPLVMSYVPRLLPQYRDHCRLDDAANECELTPSTYRKWHRLVFPHRGPPSQREAVKAIRYLSTRDRREITRIARLVSDEAVAQKGFSPPPLYRDLWTRWLQHKGPDLTIVFE